MHLLKDFEMLFDCGEGEDLVREAEETVIIYKGRSRFFEAERLLSEDTVIEATLHQDVFPTCLLQDRPYHVLDQVLPQKTTLFVCEIIDEHGQ